MLEYSPLDKQGKRGATLDEITENSTINEYAASILLDMGLSGRIITHKRDIITSLKSVIFFYMTR